jgi:hypothetical protein
MRAASGCWRTAVERKRDAFADRMGRDVAAAASAAPAVTGSVVVDPFAGSANTLYWLARYAQARRTVEFELDERLIGATHRNLPILGCEVELSHVGYEAGLERAGRHPDLRDSLRRKQQLHRWQRAKASPSASLCPATSIGVVSRHVWSRRVSRRRHRRDRWMRRIKQ